MNWYNYFEKLFVTFFFPKNKSGHQDNLENKDLATLPVDLNLILGTSAMEGET